MASFENGPERQGGTREAALGYASAGFSVFPCKPDKSPRTANGFYDATTDQGQIRRWWAENPGDLIGLRTGQESGVFVLDIDNGEEGAASLAKLETEHGRLPETYTVRTPGNPERGKEPGGQRYFRHPGGKVKSTVSVLGDNLDVRGDGGYVIAPPSRGYAVASGEFGAFVDAPGWLVDLVRDDAPAQERGLGETFPEGRRNASLASLAGSMRLRGASTNAILAALNEENNVKCHPPLPWREVAAIAKSVGRYAPGSLPRTDTGNAERLVGRHGHDLKHVYGLGWFAWTGTHWQRDETGEVERRAKETVRSIHEEAARVADDEKRKELAKWAIASESAARIRAMISLAKSEPGVPLRVDDLDRDPWLLNCENGTVDLKTGEFSEHRREDLITKLAPAKYEPDASSPTWEAFLERVLPSENVRAFVRRMVGYSLTGTVKEKVLPFLYGPKDTGKTTFVETIMNLLGDGYAQPAAPNLLLAKGGTSHPTELADLLGKRFVATVEVQQGRRLAESLVKQLTGGDRIKARFMREDFFSFRPTHKVWFAANHRPIVRGTDDAIWGRIKLVPFEVQIPEEEQDKTLAEKLRTEAAGILAWAVRGCLEWQRHGSLGEPEEVRAATREYQEEMDPLADFFEERCELRPDAWASKKALQHSYKGWCEQAGQKQLDWNAVADRLKELGCVRKRRQGKHGWLGVGLREPDIPGGDDEGTGATRVPPVPPGAPDPDMDGHHVEEDPVQPTDRAPVGHHQGTRWDTRVSGPEEMPALVEEIRTAAAVGLDLETTGLDPGRHEARLLSLVIERGAWVVDLSVTDPAPVLEALKGKTLVVHNAAFDLGFLSRRGYEHEGEVVDTMLLSQLLHAGASVPPLKGGRTSHALDAVCRRELGIELDKGQQAADWAGELTEAMVGYAARDAEVLIPLYRKLTKDIEEAGMSRVREIEQRARPAISWMARAGVPFDEARWLEIAKEAGAEAARLDGRLREMAPPRPDGKEWNWNSPEQVKAALAAFGIVAPNTRDENLARYDHGFVRLLREYRKKNGIAARHGGKWLLSKDGTKRVIDGRIYPAWRQIGAATGRMACTEPNLQAIPHGSGHHSCVRAPEGRVLVKADYSQIELRLAAKMWGEPVMLRTFGKGGDIHTLTAQSITGRADVTREERRLAKAVNFGLIFGQGAKGLKDYARDNYGVEMTLEEAKAYRERFFETYKGIARWHAAEGGRLDRREFDTCTLTGRRRQDVRSYTEHLNAPVQGTAADGMKAALALLWERRHECPGAVPILAVHDEIVVECDAHRAQEAKAWLIRAMKDGMDAVVNEDEPRVPIEVKASVSEEWGD